MIEDRAGGAWVGTGRGVVRLRVDGSVAFDDRDPAGSPVTALFEDREGNLWMGTPRGIERWRARTFLTYANGPIGDSHGPVFVDLRSRVWFAPATGGLAWFDGAGTGRVAALDGDVVYSFAAERVGPVGRTPARRLHPPCRRRRTIRRQDLPRRRGSPAEQRVCRDGRSRRIDLGRHVERRRQPSRERPVHDLHDRQRPAVELGIGNRGRCPGLVWVGTPAGLSRYSSGQWTTIGGLPSLEVNALYTESDVMWVGTSAGLAYIAANKVQVPQTTPAVLKGPVHGMATIGIGWLWIATASHVLRVSRAALLSGAVGDADVREYGLADGLRSVETMKRQPSVVVRRRRADLVLAQPRPVGRRSAPRHRGARLRRSCTCSACPPTGPSMSASAPLRLPSPRQRITFSFAGLSLAVPERVRFRYRLDGFDQRLERAVTGARQAVYTNLRPGPYTFRVMASNSDGIWNGAEAAVPFDDRAACSGRRRGSARRSLGALVLLAVGASIGCACTR